MMAINPISRTSVVLLMPGLATLICSAIAIDGRFSGRTGGAVKSATPPIAPRDHTFAKPNVDNLRYSFNDR